MATGFYMMHRGWMDNPALGGSREPFCRRAAWCWMIEQAAWKQRRENIAGRTFGLERGQFTASLRFMADAWGWSVGAVRRFIERLETDTMIGTDTGTGQIVITICNYSKYQAEADATGTPSGTPSGTGRAQDEHKVERREEGKKEESIDQRSVKFEEWWSLVPRKVGKGQARSAFKAALRKASFQTLTDGIRRYAESVLGKEAQYVCHPSTWLNGERWLDDSESPIGGSADDAAFDREYQAARAKGPDGIAAFLEAHPKSGAGR